MGVATAPELDETREHLYHKPAGCGLFYLVGRVRPTNYMILCQRPLNRDLKKPNCNDDWLSPMFRDHVMPKRKYLHKIPLVGRGYKFTVEKLVGASGMINYVDARTSWMDDIVHTAVQVGMPQVVVIAAGYCTRAYRLAGPNTKFFEVDLPQVSKKKQEMVDAVIPDQQKYPRPAFVAADLAVTKLAVALAAHGFDPSKPALFTCEGIFCYLPQAIVDSLIEQITEIAAPDSEICFDVLHRDVLEGRTKIHGFKTGAKVLAARGEPLLSGFEPGAPAMQDFFRPYGWDLVELLSPKDMAAKRMTHLKWSDRYPPMLPYESFAHLKKPAADAVVKAAAPGAAPVLDCTVNACS